MTAAPVSRRTRRSTAGARLAAAVLPVARVAVDVSLAHLDRPYDYLVAEPDGAAAQPGVRVRVRFAGRLVGGFVLARLPNSEHPGRLGFIERVVSEEQVLTREIADLARAVAERYAGSAADVLRLAVPPRHARVESGARLLATAAGRGQVDTLDRDGANVAVAGDGRDGPGSRDRTPGLRNEAQAADGARVPAIAAGRDAPDSGDSTGAPPIPSRRDAPDSRDASGRAAGTVPTPARRDAPESRDASGRAAGTVPTASRRDAPDSRDAAGYGAAGPPNPAPAVDDRTGWARYTAGPAFLRAIRDGLPARAIWQALAGESWPDRLAEAAATAAAAGRGALLVVPDGRDLARLDAALTALLPPGVHLTLSAELGPAERYRRFLTVVHGTCRVVAGTRAAIFAPVRDLGLLAIFDDGDDLLREPRAPYPHAREVLMLRSVARSCPLLIAGFARTAEAQLLIESGWARTIGARRARVRECAPRIEASGDDHAIGADSAAARARLTPAAFSAAREALAAGSPVLVQVPRRGYLPAVACARCRRRAGCRHCRGPLALGGQGRLLSCRWCGRVEASFRCPACGFDRVRASVIGAGRTAEEIGRAFAGVPVLTSSGRKVRATVPDEPALVVATPGAEPVAEAGYGAALLLDGGALLGRQDLRAAEETLRRWMAAATLVRPASGGGRVIVAADASLPTVQALIRWDPVGHAESELAARVELGFPPAVAMASVEGEESVVLAALDRFVPPVDAEILGPIALDEVDEGMRVEVPGPGQLVGPEVGGHGPAAGFGPAGVPAPGALEHHGLPERALGPGSADQPMQARVRALVRAPRSQWKALSAALNTVAAARSARKEGGGVRIQVDPLDLF